MTQAAAYFTTAFTACLLAVMVLACLTRGRFFPPSGETKGLPVNAFHWFDLVPAFSIALILSAPALSSYQTYSETSNTELRLDGIFLSCFVQLAIALPAIWRLWQLKRIQFVPPNLKLLIQIAVFSIVAFMVTMGVTALLQHAGFIKYLTTHFVTRENQVIVQSFLDGPLPVKIGIALTAIIIAPLTEEICFRGYLYPVMKKYTGAVFACIFTSLLFGIIHASLVQFIPLSIFAVILTIGYEKTNRIITPIIMHMVFNAANIIIMAYSLRT